MESGFISQDGKFAVSDYEEGVALEQFRGGNLHTRLVFRNIQDLRQFVRETRLMAEERAEEDKKVRPLIPAVPERVNTNYMKGQTIRCLTGAVVLKKKTALRMYYAAGGIVTYLSLYNTVNCGLSLLLECGEYLTVLFSFENAPTMLRWTDEMTALAAQYQVAKMTVCKDSED